MIIIYTATIKMNVPDEHDPEQTAVSMAECIERNLANEQAVTGGSVVYVIVNQPISQ